MRRLGKSLETSISEVDFRESGQADPGPRPIGTNLFRMFSSNSHRIVILSGAPHRLIA
jgi:hypothetical protein